MANSRQTRRLFHTKQKSVDLKRGSPKSREGSIGDLTIRNVASGIFLFFKSIGGWFKIFNSKNDMIPDIANTYNIGSKHLPWRKLFVSNQGIYLGNTKSEQGKIGLSSDNKYLTFQRNDFTVPTTIVEEETVGLNTFIDLGGLSGSSKAPKFAMKHNEAATGMFQTDDGNVTLLSFDTTNDQINFPKGVLKITEATAPSSISNGAGLLFLDTADDKLKYMHASINGGSAVDLTLVTTIGSYLPLGGGAMTGAITTNSTFDGVDVDACNTLAVAALPKAGGTLTGTLILDNAGVTAAPSSAGKFLAVAAAAYIDNDTSDGGTAAQNFYGTRFSQHAIRPNSGSITTTNAATVYIEGATTAGSGQTITNTYSLWIDAGESRFDGAIITNSTVDGVDIATRDGVLTSTTTTANAALPIAGGTLTGNTLCNEHMGVVATKNFYFDGAGGHTYIGEVSADVMNIIVGGDTLLQLNEDGADGNTAWFRNSCAGFTRLDVVISNSDVGSGDPGTIGVKNTGGTNDTDIDFRHSNKARCRMDADINQMNLIFPGVSGNFIVTFPISSGNHDVTNWKAWEVDETAANGNADVIWPGGTAPTFTDASAADKTDIVSFYWDASDQIAYGTASLDFS